MRRRSVPPRSSDGKRHESPCSGWGECICQGRREGQQGDQRAQEGKEQEGVLDHSPKES